MAAEHASTQTSSKIEVISNPRVDDLKTMYSLALWLEKENSKEKDPLGDKRSFGDLIVAKEEELQAISQEIQVPVVQIRTTIAHFQKDLQHICKS